MNTSTEAISVNPWLAFRAWLETASDDELEVRRLQYVEDALDADWGEPASFAQECLQEQNKRKTAALTTPVELFAGQSGSKNVNLFPKDFDNMNKLFMFFMADCFDPIVHVIAADSFDDAYESLIHDLMPGDIQHYLVDPDDEDYKEEFAKEERGEGGRLTWTDAGWLDLECLQGREITRKDITFIRSKNPDEDPSIIEDEFIEFGHCNGSAGHRSSEGVDMRSKFHPRGSNPEIVFSAIQQHWIVLDKDSGRVWKVEDDEGAAADKWHPLRTKLKFEQIL